MTAYNNKVKELQGLETIEGLSNKPSQVIQLKELKEVTEYTYIAFGISEKGEIYGVPAYANFKTDRNKVKMTENPAWTIEYAGAGNVLGTDYKHTAKVTSTDENMYFVTSYSKEMVDFYDIADLAANDLAYFQAYIAEAQKENPNMTYSDGLYKGDASEGLNIVPGNWYAIAVGVTAEGELSGLYAISELIAIPKETPTPEYSEWVGRWTWTGANGKTATVEFIEDNPNYTYYMVGWDGYGTDLEKNPAILVDWIPEENSWLIYPSYIATADFTMGDGSTAQGDMYVMGIYEASDGESYYHGLNYPICAGSIDENGTKYTIGYQGVDETGEEYTISTMEYIAFLNINGEVGAAPVTATELPTFPATITEAVDEGTGEGGGEAAPASLRKSVKKAPINSKINLMNKNLKANVSIR